MNEHELSRRRADGLSQFVSRRFGVPPGGIACPGERSAMTPCVARDGHLAVADAVGGDVCVGCERRVKDLLAREIARRDPGD